MQLAKYLFLILLTFSLGVRGSNLSIRILNHDNLSPSTITIERGLYTLYHQGKNYTLRKGAEIKIFPGLNVVIDDSIKVKSDQIALRGSDYVNHFSILRNGKKTKYDDDLTVLSKNSGVHFINSVDIDHYVAGVVEGEAGYNLPLEYYKLQAILCRTYALKNIDRHQKEGFNLCDEVHCQVYHKKCTQNEIVEATAASSGLVVVDNDLNLINTTFHSNCGGQTRNSEDVWISELSYLKSVKDSFCHQQPHSDWETCVTRSNFDSIIYKNGQLDSMEMCSVLNFCQDTGRYINKKLIFSDLTKLRRDFKLRSTFFTIQENGDSVYFYGKGFGHGVGLCQEGGIVMAKQGYSYVDILKYYYTSIHIVNQKALLFFKEE